MAAGSAKDEFAPPDDKALARALGGTKVLWDELIGHIETTRAPVMRRWGPSKTMPLGFLRLIRKDRTILYLLPREGYFLTGFVFGEKATAAVRGSDVPAKVIQALNQARVYTEGRGLRLETRTARDLATMKKLAAIKMTP